jgi:hypothetical protein
VPKKFKTVCPPLTPPPSYLLEGEAYEVDERVAVDVPCAGGSASGENDGAHEGDADDEGNEWDVADKAFAYRKPKGRGGAHIQCAKALQSAAELYDLKFDDLAWSALQRGWQFELPSNAERTAFAKDFLAAFADWNESRIREMFYSEASYVYTVWNAKVTEMRPVFWQLKAVHDAKLEADTAASMV